MRKLVGRKRQAPSEQQTARYDRITKIEAQILQRIQKLKLNTKSFVCEHFNITSPQAEPYQQDVNYYDRFWKRFLINEIGKQNIIEFRNQIENFARKLEKIQSLFEQWALEVEPVNKSRKRGGRMDEEQGEVCPYCQKTYRDEETLVIHMKIKHQDYAKNIPQRVDQQLQESIYESQSDG